MLNELWKQNERSFDKPLVSTFFLLNIFGREQTNSATAAPASSKNMMLSSPKFSQLLKASHGFYLGLQVFSFVPFGQKLVSMHPKCRVSS